MATKKTRNNHYVAQWHQKGFLDEGSAELVHLKRRVINPILGKKVVYSKKLYKPSQCFYQRDLYTTFLGVQISDDIEHQLFGRIDDSGSTAVRAFLTDDQSLWHSNFQNLFIYLDAQKLRTPKGLDWVKSKYPLLNQNELMKEMQSLRSIHCTLWAEGVRELVSAVDSELKFILSDHPVIIYNYAIPPNSELCKYPNDPDIALKGSQTIFPLDKNRCLILTNLEYAQNPSEVNPIELRTNATKVRSSMVNTIEFINTRKLKADDVAKINFIIKSRAKDSIAAGRDEWIHPEEKFDSEWVELRHILLPPKNQLYRFGGEMYAKFEDGRVHYQDAFGRTTPPNKNLFKNVNEGSIGPNDDCGCGSYRKYKNCCKGVPEHLRTTWAVMSIRERNLAFCRAIRGILKLDEGKTWTDVRKEISDEQISEIYGFYGSLWPSDTDFYAMLPKSDGKCRALFAGHLDVRTIEIVALRIASHFEEFLIESPIVNPNNVNVEFNPVKSPNSYKYQALKDFSFMLLLEPYIHFGLVNLIPNPNEFDLHLHRALLDIANERRDQVTHGKESRALMQIAVEDLLNSTHPMPRNLKIPMIVSELGFTEKEAQAFVDKFEAEAETVEYYLTLLKPYKKGQFFVYRGGPNYEMALFIAQATGSVIVTDSESRWAQLLKAQHRDRGIASYPWEQLCSALDTIPYDNDATNLYKKSSRAEFVRFRNLLRLADGLTLNNDRDSVKMEKLGKQITELSELFLKKEVDTTSLKVLSPERGFYDKTVQRLLVLSSCPSYDNFVRSVYYVGH